MFIEQELKSREVQMLFGRIIKNFAPVAGLQNLLIVEEKLVILREICMCLS